MCDRVISEDSFLIVYCSDQYKAQQMCDKAVDNSLAALKLIADWLITSKMIKKVFTALYADKNILYFNEDSGNVVFSCNEMGIPDIDLYNNSLENNFDEDDLDTMFISDIFSWHIKFEKTNALKKELNEELMPIG